MSDESVLHKMIIIRPFFARKLADFPETRQIFRFSGTSAFFPKYRYFSVFLENRHFFPEYLHFIRFSGLSAQMFGVFPVQNVRTLV